MNYNDLTSKQIQKARSIYKDKTRPWDDRMDDLMELFEGLSERQTRKWCTNLGFSEKGEVEPEQYSQARLKIFDKTKKRFIFTWGQNNTPVHPNFLRNLEIYAKFINASLHVILGRYKNPTSIFEEEEKEFWAEEIIKYADANRHDIHKYLSVMGDIKIHPTAVNPMSSMEGLSGINSCIFGAPKVQLETIPVIEGCKPKIMATTGAVTLANYTDSKSGKKGEFHHTLGCIVVEIEDDETVIIRSVTADDETGNFTDLFFKIENGEISNVEKIEAAVLGDLHYGHHDQAVINSTLKFFDRIAPKNIILHDVFDGNSISHHEMKNPFIQYGKEIHGTNDLGKEVKIMMDGLSCFEKFEKVVIVRSNHDDFLDRWLQNEDWKKQPTFKNSPLYMKYSAMLLEQYASASGDVIGVIPALINERFPNFITLGRNSTFKVKNWELGQHGDVGSNGSKGSLQQFRRLNTKIVVGHYHAPGRKDGALAVGTSTHLRVGYNKGASGWLQSHVLIHEDGKAQHINFVKNIKGECLFTTLDRIKKISENEIKKTPAIKTPVKKSATRKVVSRKIVSKKPDIKKPVAKKTSAKKPTIKKAISKNKKIKK
jgi:hypothetical protein